MASGSHTSNGLGPEAREHLERIVVEILGLASDCKDRAIRQILMECAAQLSAILDQ